MCQSNGAAGGPNPFAAASAAATVTAMGGKRIPQRKVGTTGLGARYPLKSSEV